METESLLLSYLDSMRDWWEIMSSLQSDLKEIRSLQLDTPSLSLDSRSVRYEQMRSFSNNNSSTVVSSRTNLLDNNKSVNNNRDKQKTTMDKGILIKGITKKKEIIRNHHSAKKRKCESSNFNYIAPERYPKYPVGMYKALKAGLGIYDLLALVHVVPAPWDHPFKPPYYPPIPIPNILKFTVIDFD